MSTVNNDTVFLEITSFVGFSVGASHFYAHITGYDENNKYKRIELSRILTDETAIEYNRRENRRRGLTTNYTYKPGMKVNGFDTRDEAINQARKDFKIFFPEAKKLILGNPAFSSEHQEILESF